MWSLSFLTFSLSVLTTYTNAAVPAGTREDLTSLLSSSAQILTPEAATFASFTTRWTGFNAPIASLVVVPANADDVAKTVSSHLPSRLLPYLS